MDHTQAKAFRARVTFSLLFPHASQKQMMLMRPSVMAEPQEGRYLGPSVICEESLDSQEHS